MRQSVSLARSLARDSGGRLFGVFWGSLVAVDLATVLRVPSAVGVAGVLLVVALGSRRQSTPTLLAAAAMGWLFVNGFLVNHLGQLGWHGLPDLWRLLLLVGAAWVAARSRDLDVILTGRRGRRPTARVSSLDGPGHPGSPLGQERHAVGR